MKISKNKISGWGFEPGTKMALTSSLCHHGVSTSHTTAVTSNRRILLLLVLLVLLVVVVFLVVLDVREPGASAAPPATAATAAPGEQQLRDTRGLRAVADGHPPRRRRRPPADAGIRRIPLRVRQAGRGARCAGLFVFVFLLSPCRPTDLFPRFFCIRYRFDGVHALTHLCSLTYTHLT